MARHRLVGVGEVAVVAVGARRHARGDAGVELARVEPPLLPRVAAEELQVEVAAHLGDHDVLRCLDLGQLLGDRLEPALHLEGRQVEAVEAIDRVEVDPHRQQLAVDAGEHAVLVRPPLGELRQVLEDVGRVGVEDVRPVGMDEDAGVVVAVVRVAADVRALVDDEHALAEDVGEPFGEHAAGEAGADDEGVEAGATGDGARCCRLKNRTAFVHMSPFSRCRGSSRRLAGARLTASPVPVHPRVVGVANESASTSRTKDVGTCLAALADRTIGEPACIRRRGAPPSSFAARARLRLRARPCASDATAAPSLRTRPRARAPRRARRDEHSPAKRDVA